MSRGVSAPARLLLVPCRLANRHEVDTRFTLLSDRRAPEAFPSAPGVHGQVDDEGESGVEVPSVEGQRHLGRLAVDPVEDSRHENVHGDEEEQKIRQGKTASPFEERPDPNQLGSHSTDDPAALDEMHQHQPDEHESDDSVVGDPYVQELQCAERGRC